MNDFLVGGGDDFKGFGGLPVATVGPLDTEALESYLTTLHGELMPPSGPRIFVPGGGSTLTCQATSSP